MTRKTKRKDQLTAQRVEVGLVFQKMLSTDDAAEYMVSNRVPEEVIKRVLDDPTDRRKTNCLERRASSRKRPKASVTSEPETASLDEVA
jgi:hypothetical protein